MTVALAAPVLAFVIGEIVAIEDMGCSLCRMGLSNAKGRIGRIQGYDEFWQTVHTNQGFASHRVHAMRLLDGTVVYPCELMLRRDTLTNSTSAGVRA